MNRLLCIVRTLYQRNPAPVAVPFGLWRMKGEMVNGAIRRANPSLGDPPERNLQRDLQINASGENFAPRIQPFVEHLCLKEIARKSVEEKPLGPLSTEKPPPHHGKGWFIWHKLALLQRLFKGCSERGFARDLRPEKLSGRDVLYIQRTKFICQRAFAGSWRTDK